MLPSNKYYAAKKAQEEFDKLVDVNPLLLKLASTFNLSLQECEEDLAKSQALKNISLSDESGNTILRSS